jgi:hypothetical protein
MGSQEFLSPSGLTPLPRVTAPFPFAVDFPSMLMRLFEALRTKLVQKGETAKLSMLLAPVQRCADWGSVLSPNVAVMGCKQPLSVYGIPTNLPLPSVMGMKLLRTDSRLRVLGLKQLLSSNPAEVVDMLETHSFFIRSCGISAPHL